MKVNEFIEFLKTLNQDMQIMVSSDEEWNTIFSDFRVDSGLGIYVIFGISGSELSE